MSLVDAIRNTQEAELLKLIYDEMHQAVNRMSENDTSKNVAELNKDSSKVKLKVNTSVLDTKLQEVKRHTNDLEKKIKDLENEIILDTERIQTEQEKLLKAKLAAQFSKDITGTKICFQEGQYVGKIMNNSTKKSMLFVYDQDDADLSSKMWDNMSKLCIN